MTKDVKFELLYFAVRNTKLKIGFTIISIFICFALFSGFFAKYKSTDFVGDSNIPPSSQFWLGTTNVGEDVFAQIVDGIRSAFIVGLFGGGIATFMGLFIGFFAGFKGGIFDEILMMFTNIMLVIPTLVILIILAAYLPYRGIGIECIIVGFTAWPWTARAVRSQTFSLKERGFVDLARISGRSSLKIILQEVAPNMLSYVVMVFIIQFGASILIASGIDFIGLGPQNAMSLGIMMSRSFKAGAITFGNWWWLIPPGAIITMIVSSLYLMNTGLDEVFNPKLREK